MFRLADLTHSSSPPSPLPLAFRNRDNRWERLEKDFPESYFEASPADTVGLSDLGALGQDIIKGQVRGRVVVDLSKL